MSDIKTVLPSKITLEAAFAGGEEFMNGLRTRGKGSMRAYALKTYEDGETGL